LSWDPIWESIFRSRDWGRYPPEEVVRFVARHYFGVPDRAAVRMLDLGCGPGTGTSWLIAREGFALAGIDASPTAIGKARERFAAERLQADFRIGVIDQLPWQAASFDAVIDIVCLACNAEKETALIIDEIYRVLKPGGWHFSLTPKAGCWGDGTGECIDATTRRSVETGPFADLGMTRFATEASLRRLYARFAELEIEYSVRSADAQRHEITHWAVTCRK
jgi:SAM-dependent methyltransferase